MSNPKKCYACGSTENLESTIYIDKKKESHYETLAVVTRKTTTPYTRFLCLSCITKAKKYSKKILFAGIIIILFGVIFNIYVEIFHAPGFFGRLFTKNEPLDFLDIIQLVIIGVGIIIMAYGDRIRAQPSRYY